MSGQPIGIFGIKWVYNWSCSGRDRKKERKGHEKKVSKLVGWIQLLPSTTLALSLQSVCHHLQSQLKFIVFTLYRLEPGKIHRLGLLHDLHLTSLSYDDSLPLDAANSRSSLRLHCVPVKGAVELKEDGEEDEEEEDEEEEDEDVEEQTYTLASLSTKGSLHSALSVELARDEEIGLSITGSHPVDVVGNYIFSESDDQEGQSELDSDEYDLSPDSDEYDSEDMGGAQEAYMKMLKEGGEIDSDDEDEDEERFQELADSESSKPTKANKKQLVAAKAAADAANGKKRPRDDQEEAGDVSMASSNGAGATDAELLAAGVQPAELEGLSRNQKKRLNKKLKTVGGEATEADVSTEKPAKKEVKKVEVEKKEPKKEAPKEAKKVSSFYAFQFLS